MEYFYLKEYAEKMQKIADECVDRILKGQNDGMYTLKIHSLKRDFNMEHLDEELLADMLSERDEFSITDFYSDEITVSVAPEYAKHEEDTNLKLLSAHDIQVMLSKHYLWLYDEYGGVQADFSNCYVEGVDFFKADLCSCVMNGAKFVNCSFYKTSMCTAECVGTKFSNCDMRDITCEECNFHGAEFRYCDMERGIYTHSNFHKALFVQSELGQMDFSGSCVAETDWIDTNITECRMDNTTESFDDWQDQGDVPGLDM